MYEANWCESRPDIIWRTPHYIFPANEPLCSSREANLRPQIGWQSKLHLYIIDRRVAILPMWSAPSLLRGSPCQDCWVPEHGELIQVLKLDSRSNYELYRVPKEHTNLEASLCSLSSLNCTTLQFPFSAICTEAHTHKIIDSLEDSQPAKLSWVGFAHFD